MLELGGVVAGRYRLEAQLGAGASARVFRAVDGTLARHVAIKFLFAGAERDQQAFAERFLREARLAAAVDHANVMRTLDFGASEGRPFIVMELLHGQTLAARLAAPPRVEVAEAVEITLGALAGLGAVHRAGIVHRDLKPENVYLAEDGAAMRPKLMDFGVSRVSRVSPAEPHGVRSALSSQDGMIIGTPEYMSPEQARGVRDIDVRSDLYAVGVILFELLTGRLPYEAETMADLLVKIARGGAPNPAALRPELPHGLCAVVMQAMAHDPSGRFSDARAMANALCAVMGLAPEAASRGTVQHFVRAAKAATVAEREFADARTVQARAQPTPRAGAYAEQGMELSRAALADLSDVLETHRSDSVPISALPGLQTQVARLQDAVGELQLDPAAAVQVRRLARPQQRPAVGVVIPGEHVRRRRFGGGGFPFGWLLAAVGVGVLGYRLTEGDAADAGAPLLERARRVVGEVSAHDGPAGVPPANAPIRVRLQGVPEAAVVRLDGSKRGETEFELPADGALHHVEVQQRGMRPWSATFEARQNHTFVVLLIEERPRRLP